jgi:hypothetical protein
MGKGKVGAFGMGSNGTLCLELGALLMKSSPLQGKLF